MTYNDENELTRDEIDALSALPRQKQPSDLLEERVVHALRMDGYLGAGARGRQKRGLSLALRIAAAFALFAGGVGTGRYLLADAPQSASTAASSTIVRERDTTVPNPGTRQVNRNRESVIAEREMWL